MFLIWYCFINDYYLADDEADRKKKKKDKAMGEQVSFMPDIRYRFSNESTDRGKKPQIFAKPSIKSDGLNVLDFIGDQKEVVALSSSVIPLCHLIKIIGHCRRVVICQPGDTILCFSF